MDSLAPVIAAPMSGGPTTPALVAAATSAGCFGFLAFGYLTPDAAHDQLRRPVPPMKRTLCAVMEMPEDHLSAVRIAAYRSSA